MLLLFFLMARSLTKAALMIATLLVVPTAIHAADCFIVAGQSNAVGVKGVGLELGLSRQYESYFGQAPEIIKFAVSGSSITRWIPTGDLYAPLLGEIDGRYCPNLVWVQGEKDSQDSDLADAYYDNLLLLIQSLERDLAYRLTVLLVEISNREQFTFTIARAQRRLGRLPTVYLIPTLNLRKRDTVHYSVSGLNVLGQRVFDVWIDR